jgi:hypothetical protein
MVTAACPAYIGNVLEMFGFLRRRKPNSEEFRYSERDFNALIGAAMSLSHELEPLIFQGRQKAQRPVGARSKCAWAAFMHWLNMSPTDKASSPDYRQPVLEALCAFVREHTIGMIVAERPTTDVQAVLTVIGRRRPQNVPAGRGQA